MQKLGAIVMLGSGGSSPQEQLVLAAQRAATIDLVYALNHLNINPIILCSQEFSWWVEDIPIWLAPDPVNRTFHFGEHLAETIIASQLDHVVYFGGASAPLLDQQMLSLLFDLLRQSPTKRTVICNNLHSSDWVGLTNVKDALSIIKAAERDNGLAWALREEGHYHVRVLPEIRQAAAMDIDTPTDLAILRHHAESGPALRQALGSPLLDSIPVQAVIDTIARPGSHLALIGRVSPRAWDALSHASQCWIRVFSEERGMIASGRAVENGVRSLLGVLLDLQGPQMFFETLGSMVDAAIIDSRVLFAHRGLQPSAADRFASDLFWVDAIEDPWIREFTAAAAAAPIPIILGGHSAVGGGLHVLSEILAARATPN